MKNKYKILSVALCCVILISQYFPAMVANDSVSMYPFWGGDPSQTSLIEISGSELMLNEYNGSITNAFSINPQTGQAKTDYLTTHTLFNFSVTNNATAQFNAIISLRLNDVTKGIWEANTNSISMLIYPTYVVLKRVANGISQESATLNKSFTDGNQHKYDIVINDITKVVSLTIDGSDSNKIQISCSQLPQSGGFQVMAMKSQLVMTNFFPDVTSSMNTTDCPFSAPLKWDTFSAYKPLVSFDSNQLKIAEDNGNQTIAYSVDQFSNQPKNDYDTQNLSFSMSAVNTGTPDWNVVIGMRFNNITTSIWDTGSNGIFIVLYPDRIVLKRVANGIDQDTPSTLYTNLVDGLNHTYDFTINDVTKTIDLTIDGNNTISIACSAIPSFGGMQVMTMKSHVTITNTSHDVSTYSAVPRWDTFPSQKPYVSSGTDFINLTDNGEIIPAYSVDPFSAQPKTNYDTKHLSFTMSATNSGTSSWNVIVGMRFNNITSAIWNAGSTGIFIVIYPDRIVLERINNAAQQENTTYYTTSLVNGNNHTYDFTFDDISKTVKLAIDGTTNLLINCSELPSLGGLHVMSMKSQVAISKINHNVSINPNPIYDTNKTAKIFGKDSNGDKIIANINVMDSPYNAAGDGISDDTNAIQKALGDVSVGGGGIVFIPKGNYVIRGNLCIPSNTVLRGEWNAPDCGGSANGTILMAYSGRGSETGQSFISMGGASCLKNISVWYPEQTASNIQPYPWTIEFADGSCMIEGVTLYNSWQGINTCKYNGSAQHVFKVYGTPLKIGMTIDRSLETSEFSTVRFSIDIWSQSGLSGYPSSTTDFTNVRTYTRVAVGIKSGRHDEAWLYDIGINPYDYPIGIQFYRGTTEGLAGGTYGHIMNIYNTQINILALDDYSVGLDIVDNVPSMPAPPQYIFAEPRFASNDTIVSVCDIAYGAKGDGTTDDTSAFQNALNAMSALGGGTVFVPAKRYKINGTLLIPTGVELRGIYEGPFVGLKAPVSELHAYSGRGTTTGTPFITLQSGSGIHGIAIDYPEQQPDSIVAYPYTVKGNGANTWIENTTFINSYSGVDYSSVQCNNFLIKNVWATFLKNGFTIGGGSQSGVIQSTFVSYAIWYNLIADTTKANSMHTYCYTNSVSLLLGNTSNLTGWSVCTFDSYKGVVTSSQNRYVPTNITFYRLGLDMPNGNTGLDVSYASNINIYGASFGVKTTDIKDSATSGTVNVYGYNDWGSGTRSIHSNTHLYARLNPSTSSPNNITTTPSQNSSGLQWGTVTGQQSYVTVTDTKLEVIESSGSQNRAFSTDRYTHVIKSDFSTKRSVFTLSATNTGSSSWNAIVSLRFNNLSNGIWDSGSNAISILLTPTDITLKRISNGVTQEYSTISKALVNDGIAHTYDININDDMKTVTAIIDNDISNELQITCSSLPIYGGFQVMAMKSDVIMTEFINEVGDRYIQDKSNVFWKKDYQSSNITIGQDQVTLTASTTPIKILSSDKLLQNPKVGYVDDDIHYNMKITNPVAQGDFYSLFALRTNKPQNHLWELGTDSIFIGVYASGVAICNSINGQLVSMSSIISGNYIDGNDHSYHVVVNDVTKTIILTIDNDPNKSCSLSVQNVPISGGYSVTAMKSTVLFSQFSFFH